MSGLDYFCLFEAKAQELDVYTLSTVAGPVLFRRERLGIASKR
jgi:hypothetical protein